LALVQLDGATTVLLHYLLDVTGPDRISIGRRVQVIIKPKRERTGSILDIEGFRPLNDAKKVSATRKNEPAQRNFAR
jgi:uncharacterized OB-fold protein